MLIHPGEYIKDYLIGNSVTKEEFAKQLGISLLELENLLKGKASIDQDLSIVLQDITGVRAEIWLNFQKRYDLKKGD